MAALTEAEARTLLKSMTAWDQDPALSEDEITALLRGATRADVYGVAPDTYAAWQPATAYAVGTEIVPTVRNGHYYKVTAHAGGYLSGTVEPVWPTTSEGTVTDNELTWTEQGAGAVAWVGEYNLNSAAAKGWRLKAGKCATQITFSTDGQTFNRREKREGCLQLAREYERRIVGSVPYTGALAQYGVYDDDDEV